MFRFTAGKKINSRQKQNTEKQSEQSKQSKQNELTPQQKKITPAKQTLKIDGAGYVSHFKAVFVQGLWQFVIWEVVHANSQ